jgi:hypothetical protein
MNPEDLEAALMRTHLEAPKEERESDGSGGASPNGDTTKAQEV